MDCDNCKGKLPENIPFTVHDLEMARAERHAKRWMIAAWVLAVALLLTNAVRVVRKVTKITQKAE